MPPEIPAARNVLTLYSLSLEENSRDRNVVVENNDIGVTARRKPALTGQAQDGGKVAGAFDDRDRIHGETHERGHPAAGKQIFHRDEIDRALDRISYKELVVRGLMVIEHEKSAFPAFRERFHADLVFQPDDHEEDRREDRPEHMVSGARPFFVFVLFQNRLIRRSPEGMPAGDPSAPFSFSFQILTQRGQKVNNIITILSLHFEITLL